MYLLTFEGCVEYAGFVTFALRGILSGLHREDQLSGIEACIQRGRRNINGKMACDMLFKR